MFFIKIKNESEHKGSFFVEIIMKPIPYHMEFLSA